MNGKFIIKLEKGPYEQTYKIAESAVSQDVNQVFAMLDEAFIQAASERFDQMHADFREAFERFENT